MLKVSTLSGGRVTGAGVAGLTLGGGMYDDYTPTIYCLNGYLSAGYSWLSNRYGLALDNVVAYELVVPNGTVGDRNGRERSRSFLLTQGTCSSPGYSFLL